MHGYSSSSESDDDYRRRRQPAPTTTSSTEANKKKKKKKPPPQQTINRIWKRFSNKNFNKALAVLPFDPVLPPVTDDSNELLTTGYERAAEECRRKVKKIIQECRRVNMRYRDPGWDLVSSNQPRLLELRLEFRGAATDLFASPTGLGPQNGERTLFERPRPF